MINLDLKSAAIGGMPLEVSSMKAGVSLMLFILKLGKLQSDRFSVAVGLGNYDINGVMMGYNGIGYSIMVACNSPENGFVPRPGFWAYKHGTSNEPCRWYGGGDDAWRPKRLFLPYDIAEKLVLQLYRDEPFHYDPEHWENTDDCVLPPPSKLT